MTDLVFKGGKWTFDTTCIAILVRLIKTSMIEYFHVPIPNISSGIVYTMPQILKLFSHKKISFDLDFHGLAI